MTEELIQTLRIIIDRYGTRTTGSVFMPIEDFPWHKAPNHQLTKLFEEGMITKPRFYDNGADITLTAAGRDYFNGVLFPEPGAPMTCPVCGFRARVLNTDAARSWAEISCKNCTTYAIRKKALMDTLPSDLPLLSGYYRHARQAPMTIQCDNQEMIKEHIDEARKQISRDYQIKLLLRYFYQRMKEFGDKISFECLPAIAYAKDRDDLLSLVTEAAEKGYAIFENDRISITKQGKEWIDTKDTGGIVTKDEIFISHRTTDSGVADIIKDFLVNTGIPNNKIFCSSLPGNDVGEKIAPEVKTHLHNATIIILLLSRDYYESAYCLNEAGIAWYLDDVLSIPIGMPEIDHTNMYGFLGSDYKLRKLDDDGDVSYLFDQAHVRLRTENIAHSVVTQETKKLKDRYAKYIADRKTSPKLDKIAVLEAENRELKERLTVSDIDYDDDIWEDGYHEVKNGDGEILKKGQFVNGKLIDGIVFNIVIRVSKGEDEKEQPVPPDELNDKDWHYSEYGQYDGAFALMIARDEILETGLQFFYVVDKKVKTEGKLVKSTFTNFRTLESFLSEKEPDELDYIKTGVRKYEETDYADIEVD